MSSITVALLLRWYPYSSILLPITALLNDPSIASLNSTGVFISIMNRVWNRLSLPKIRCTAATVFCKYWYSLSLTATKTSMAQNSILCTDVPLRNYSLTHLNRKHLLLLCNRVYMQMKQTCLWIEVEPTQSVDGWRKFGDVVIDKQLKTVN